MEGKAQQQDDRAKSDVDLAALRDEKNHMEGLANHRFNYLLIVVGFVVASMPYVKSVDHLRVVFGVGCLLSGAFTLLILRAMRRVNVSLKLLKANGDPISRIEAAADSRVRGHEEDVAEFWKPSSWWWPSRFSMVRTMELIPVIVTLLMLIALILAGGLYNFLVTEPCPPTQPCSCICPGEM